MNLINILYSEWINFNEPMITVYSNRIEWYVGATTNSELIL